MIKDVIYRQAAIDALAHMTSEDQGGVTVSRENVKSMLLYLSSAQPEQKDGKWIVDEKRFGCAERHCSLCGAILEGDDWKWRNNNYCYHCGARMVEGLL